MSRVRRTRQKGLKNTSHSQSPTLKVEARTFGKHDVTLPTRKHKCQLAHAVGRDNGNISCSVNSDDSRLAQDGEGHVRYTPWLVGNVKLAVDGCNGVDATKSLVVHISRSRAGLFRYNVNNGHCGPFSDNYRSLFPRGLPLKCEGRVGRMALPNIFFGPQERAHSVHATPSIIDCGGITSARTQAVERDGLELLASSTNEPSSGYFIFVW